MGVIIEFSVAPEDFGLGELLSLGPDTEVRVEQLVPIGDKVMPFSWVSGDTDSFEEDADDNGMAHSVVLADPARDRKLYRLEWNERDDELIEGILESDGAVLNATGTHEEWEFGVRFRRREDLSEFHGHCAEHGVPILVNRIYNPIEVSGDSRMGMTSTQAETLVDALEKGYFDIPRKTSLVELADDYGVSDQAVSERIRRATSELVEASLLVEEEPPFTEEAKAGND
jgi:predicted DNA binding protein